MSARPLAAVAIAGSVAVLVMVLVAAAAPVGATMPEALIRVAVVGGVGLAGHVLVLRLLGVDELADLTGLLRGVRTRFGR
jgi:hypothetical protein